MGIKMRRLLTCLMVLLLAGLGCGYAKAESAGDPAGSAEYTGVPVDQWVGKVFLVLPLEQNEAVKGYPFVLDKPSADLLAGQNGNIRYDWLEGKKLEVVAVEARAAAPQTLLKDYLVTFKDTDTGTVLQGIALGGQVPQLVLYSDMVEAEKYFTGKTIYSKRPTISVFQTEPGAIAVKMDEPLTITAVVPGVTAAEPIWLVVKTPAGQKGFIAINYSNTNVYQGMWKKGNPWSDLLLEKNPREVYSWSEEIWAAIDDGVIKIGMLPEQVVFLWGEPTAIVVDSASGEQTWTYPGKILKFNATGLYSIEQR